MTKKADGIGDSIADAISIFLDPTTPFVYPLTDPTSTFPIFWKTKFPSR